MVLSREESPIYDIKMSTVGPGVVSGQGAVQELTGLDLAMKLHYLRTVYYFNTPALEGLTIINIKETMFNWLIHASIPCGRLRRSDSGRPYIKCNDCGVRFIEARCSMSVDEWLKSRDGARDKLLVPNQVIGPDLPYSPLVLLQLTKFKCGGISVGISWAHVLGDAFSAAGFTNVWGKATIGQYPAQPLRMDHSNIEARNSKSPISDPLSIKPISPLGDLWAITNASQMETYSFCVSGPELARLQSKVCGDKDHQQIPPFESICTVVWQCVARVKHGSEPKVVTVCKRDPKSPFQGIITNRVQVIKTVKTNSSVKESSLTELGLLIMNEGVDERRDIEEAIETNDGSPDFLVYGANLTFLDMHEAPFYELDVRGHTPVYINCAIDGVGDEGLVAVLPTGKDSDGMTVSITLPGNHMSEVKSMLEEDMSFV